MTDPELATLLRDCLRLWEVDAKLVPAEDGFVIVTQAGAFRIARADPELRPARWFVRTPEREAASRPPRAAPSIGAALSVLRNQLGAAPGQRLRIGGG